MASYRLFANLVPDRTQEQSTTAPYRSHRSLRGTTTQEADPYQKQPESLPLSGAAVASKTALGAKPRLYSLGCKSSRYISCLRLREEESLLSGRELHGREAEERLQNNRHTIGRESRCLSRGFGVLLEPGGGLGGGSTGRLTHRRTTYLGR